MAVPKFLQSALWSYDLSKMDAGNKDDKRIIIEQVLNYGIWEQLKWLTNTYSWDEIKEVAKKPSRGIWMEDSLNYWSLFFGLELSANEREKALFSLTPKGNC
ncbi:hypothetical protein KJ693_04125 [bacterium]|nr:hypothetical protein [bacterium]MBU1614480.1 hypothetical protein [bacterium]